jgi:Na+-translocating membrane potential-generating system MpsC-like protein
LTESVYHAEPERQVRTHLIEMAKPHLQAMVQEITGVKVVSLHHDINTARRKINNPALAGKAEIVLVFRPSESYNNRVIEVVG